jgi:uncharacterized membrane protein YkvI
MNIEQEISQIKERNKKVEADKAWEISNFRRIIIAFFTYIIIVIFMYSAGLEQPLINALIPTMGYFLSTLTLKPLKKWWISRTTPNPSLGRRGDVSPSSLRRG